MFTQRRINRLKVKLAGLEAELAEEERMTQLSGKVYPIVRGNLTREIAEIKEKLSQLEAPE
jgi:hypothetical protein